MRSTQPDRDGTRTIAGRFAGATGAIITGTGFTVTRAGAGTYALKFDRTRAIIAFTAASDIATASVVILNSAGQPPDALTVQAMTSNTGAAADPGAVHFNAQVLPR